jgi:hypothetical protein
MRGIPDGCNAIFTRGEDYARVSVSDHVQQRVRRSWRYDTFVAVEHVAGGMATGLATSKSDEEPELECEWLGIGV